MIYGYGDQAVNEYGLMEMKEVTLSASPEELRAVAVHILEAADELERQNVSDSWHRHLPDAVCGALGCDVIVMGPPR